MSWVLNAIPVFYNKPPNTTGPSAKQNSQVLNSPFFFPPQDPRFNPTRIVLCATSFASALKSEAHFLITEARELSAFMVISDFQNSHEEKQNAETNADPKLFCSPGHETLKTPAEATSPLPCSMGLLPPWCCRGKWTYPWIPPQAHPKCFRDYSEHGLLV